MEKTPARTRFENRQLTPAEEAALKARRKRFWDDVSAYWAGQPSSIKEVDGQLRQMPEPT